MKYPPPSTHKIFVARWNDFIVSITGRENFSPGHLAQLEVLCNLYLEVFRLETYLGENGYTYTVGGGRNGFQIKQNPMVTQLNRARAEIRNYSKILGLLLEADEGGGGGGGGSSDPDSDDSVFDL